MSGGGANQRGASVGEVVRRVARQVRDNGFGWLVRRACREVRAPYTPGGRLLNALARRVLWFSRCALSHRSRFTIASDTLLAIYDTLVEPSTFDVMWFLLSAENTRIDKRLRAIHVVFIGGSIEDGRDEPAAYQKVVSQTAKRDRLMNMLMPHAWLLPSVKTVEIILDRREAKSRLHSWQSEFVFPNGYAVDFHKSSLLDFYHDVLLRPTDHGIGGAFRASSAACEYVKRWASVRSGGARLVTITLRHYDYNPARNSNIDAWAETAHYLRRRGYFPVIVPDTETTAEGAPAPLREFAQIPEAAWNLGLRMALYETAFLNLGINNGPAFLYLVNDLARGIMFKIITSGVAQNEEAYIKQQGFVIGGQIPFCSEFQKRVWEDDTFPVISREFEEMESRILEREGQE